MTIILEYKVIFHIDELSKWSIVLKNTNDLLEAINTNNFNIEILANSEAVKAYAYDNELDLSISSEMKELDHKGIKFVACNNALKSYSIKKEDLMSFVDIVPTGILELVNKQSDGYSYIKP